jgi:hypothetical protein
VAGTVGRDREAWVRHAQEIIRATGDAAGIQVHWLVVSSPASAFFLEAAL